jgi:hypothetical protein
MAPKICEKTQGIHLVSIFLQRALLSRWGHEREDGLCAYLRITEYPGSPDIQAFQRLLGLKSPVRTPVKWCPDIFPFL